MITLHSKLPELCIYTANSLTFEQQHILDVSCEVEDLGCEYSLFILQAVTHVTLEGVCQGLISGGKESDSYTTRWGKAEKRGCGNRFLVYLKQLEYLVSKNGFKMWPNLKLYESNFTCFSWYLATVWKSTIDPLHWMTVIHWLVLISLNLWTY